MHLRPSSRAPASPPPLSYFTCQVNKSTNLLIHHHHRHESTPALFLRSFQSPNPVTALNIPVWYNIPLFRWSLDIHWLGPLLFASVESNLTTQSFNSKPWPRFPDLTLAEQTDKSPIKNLICQWPTIEEGKLLIPCTNPSQLPWGAPTRKQIKITTFTSSS